jgi:hypothetical protein
MRYDQVIALKLEARIVEEEADESGYWIELLMESGKIAQTKAGPLVKESGELLAIAVSSINTARKSGGRE